MRVRPRLSACLAALCLAVAVIGQASASQGVSRPTDINKKIAPSRLTALQGLYQKQIDAKQWDDALRTLDQMGGCPACTALWHLRVYALSGDTANYVSTAEILLQGKFKGDPDVLNEIAWYIVNPDETTLRPRNLDLARETAEKAVLLSKRKDAGLLDTLAWTYHWMGQNEKATKVEREALDRAVPSEKDVYRRTLHLDFNPW